MAPLSRLASDAVVTMPCAPRGTGLYRTSSWRCVLLGTIFAVLLMGCHFHLHIEPRFGGGEPTPVTDLLEIREGASLAKPTPIEELLEVDE